MRLLRECCLPLVLVALCLFLACAPVQADEKAPARSGGRAAWRFAPGYSIDDVLLKADVARAFVHDYLVAEAPYFATAREPKSGLSYDGLNLDPATGRPVGIRAYSAPSKECLDVAVLVKAVEGNSRAALVLSPSDPAKAPALAVGILERKIASYEKWHSENPGNCGFMPWFGHGDVIKARPEWEAQVPGLDNGEWVWAMLVAEDVLRKKGHGALADRYRAFNDLMADNVVRMFYDEQAGKVRGDIRILDPNQADSPCESAQGKCEYLAGEHGVHEGGMFLMYISLFGKGLPADGVKRIWDSTRMVAVETPYGTTWQGFWGSAHEEWAFLFLPYRDDASYGKLFRVRQIIRTRNAAARNYPGVVASTQEPGGPGYWGDVGIEGVGSLPLGHTDIFAPYGAFPMLLYFADREPPTWNYAYAWLLNMLKGQKMQGPLGGGESGTNDGRKVSYTKTIDGTLPNVLAICGGLEHETAALLKARGLYDRFRAIVAGEMQEAFGAKEILEPTGFAAPRTPIPTAGLPDYEGARTTRAAPQAR